MFARVNGLQSLVLGELGSELQQRLNHLVLDGIKTGTSSVDDGEYAQEHEEFETVGEKQWLVNESSKPIALIEHTEIQWIAYKDVTLDFFVSKGEGFQSVEEWQTIHKEFWSHSGMDVTAESHVISHSFSLVESLGKLDA